MYIYVYYTFKQHLTCPDSNLKFDFKLKLFCIFFQVSNNRAITIYLQYDYIP